MAIEFFISHSHADRQLAQALVQFLIFGVGVEIKEIRCTSYVSTGLSTGTDIEQELRRDLRRSNYFVPLITSNTESSEFVAFEIGAAWILEKKIVPVVFSRGVRPRIPTVLAKLLYADLTDQETLIRLASDLAFQIFVAADRPPPPQVISAARMFLASVQS